MTYKIARYALGTILSCGLLPAAALAAETGGQSPETDERNGSGIAEIIVTAQHRSENMQDVPIAITALTGDALSSRGIDGVAALETSVPGLTYSNVAGNGQPRIRGVGTNLAGAGNEGAVSTYIDGVYLASATASMLSFNSVTQIAVLKGPQGTLFGRNTTGGLIQITTRDPSEEFVAFADATIGNRESYGGNLYMTGGLAKGLSADMAVHYERQNDGFGRNLATGNWVNRSRNISLRSKIKAELGSDTTAILTADYEKTRSSVPAFRPAGPDIDVGGASINPYAFPFPGAKFDVNTDVDPLVQVKQWGAALTLDHQFDFAKLVSITAYRKTATDVALDGDAGPFPVSGVFTQVPERQFSQELRLESAGSGPFDWQLGGYYFYGRGGYGTANINGGFLIIDTPQKTRSFAAFGQGSYRFDDRTSLTLGLRYTIERKTIDASGFFAGVDVGLTHLSRKVEKPTWRIVLDHQLTPTSLIYASYNRGFKSGGFDPGGFTPPGAGLPNAVTYFAPEVLDAFEIGTKNDLFDRRVRLNAAVFYYDYRNIQLNDFVNGTTHIYNGDSAKIYGVDADVTVIPVDGLTLTGGVSWLHSEFGDFNVGYYSAIGPGGLSGPVSGTAKGKQLPNTPEYQINLAADYEVDLPSGSLGLNISSFWSGRWYGQPENRLHQKSYNLLNASATWHIDDAKNYSLQFWGKNLGNTAYATQLVVQNFQPFGAAFDFVALSPGRTYGATVSVKF